MPMPIPIIAGLGALIPGIGSFIGAAATVAAMNTLSKENANTEEYTVSEAAELLGLSEYTIKKKIREGALNARIAGKKYMVSKKSIEKYLKEVGKSGQILGTDPIDGKFSEAWNDIALVQAYAEQIKIQQEILSAECKKLELEKKIASKNNDEDMVDEISKEILDKNVEILKCIQSLKLCEAQILYLTKKADMPE